MDINQIACITGYKAKKIINKISKNIIGIDKQIIKRWINEGNFVKCYTLKSENSKHIKSFVILSKCDFDPLKKHKDPYIIDFIYTFESYRRFGLAYTLLMHMKNFGIDMTTFCSNKSSELLFEKAGFILDTFDTRSAVAMYRYPNISL